MKTHYAKTKVCSFNPAFDRRRTSSSTLPRTSSIRRPSDDFGIIENEIDFDFTSNRDYDDHYDAYDAGTDRSCLPTLKLDPGIISLIIRILLFRIFFYPRFILYS